jgi:hypothetical protein
MVCAGVGLPSRMQAQSNPNLVVVNYTTNNASALHPGFAGFTTELLGGGVEFGDTNMQRLAQELSPGWLLYPAGTTGDAFNWATGLTEQSWVDQITAKGNPIAANLAQGTYQALRGKGGVRFTEFAKLATNVGGAQIIVCVNAFTDTPQSAGALAQFAASNHIAVAVWELCNEPYLFKGATNFFLSGSDYATKMKPYRDAIKAADPNAVVAVFFSDPGLPGTSWDSALANYPDRYWDAVVYHHYPRLPSGGSFAELMALDNGCLYSNTTRFVTNHLVTDNGPTVQFLITEFSANLGNGDGTQNPPTSTLYGGIYCAEYVMRLSSVPRMSFAGSYQLVNGSGVDLTNRYWNAVLKAATNGYVTNTIGLPFGYFLSAQGTAEGVAYGALNRSAAAYPTTVSTNGPTVSMDITASLQISAVYAQAYQGADGRSRYLLLTNKGSNAVPVQITEDGSALTNQFTETFVTGPDPAQVNTNPPHNNIVMQTNSAANPITLPPYSVVRLQWTPTVPASGGPGVEAPRLAAVVLGGDVVIDLTGTPGATYVLQQSQNLKNWADVQTLSTSATGAAPAFTPTAGATKKFYRAISR